MELQTAGPHLFFFFLLPYPKLSKQCGWLTYKYLLNFPVFNSLGWQTFWQTKKPCLAWTSATVCRSWVAEISEKCLWNKSTLCNMCGCLRDAFETSSFMKWRRNPKVTPFVPHLWLWRLNLLFCNNRLFSSAHTVSSIEAVLLLEANSWENASLLEKQGKVPQFSLL